MRVLEAPLGGTGGHGALLPMVDVGKVGGACPKLEELNVRLSAEDFENSIWDSSEGNGVGVPRTWACVVEGLDRAPACACAVDGRPDADMSWCMWVVLGSPSACGACVP